MNQSIKKDINQMSSERNLYNENNDNNNNNNGPSDLKQKKHPKEK